VKLHRTHDFAHRASGFRLLFTSGLPRNACGVSRLPLVSCRDVEFHVCPREDCHPLARSPFARSPFLTLENRFFGTVAAYRLLQFQIRRTGTLSSAIILARLRNCDPSRDHPPCCVCAMDIPEEMRHPQRAETILSKTHPFRDESLTASEAGHWNPSLARKIPKPIRADRAELKDCRIAKVPLLEPCRTPPCR